MAQIKIDIANVEVATEAEFCLDVTVEGFTRIVSTQFRMNWDTTLLAYDGTMDLGVESNGLLFAQNGDELRFTWVASDFVDGTTLDSGAVLFAICFKALKEGTSIVAIDENLDAFQNPVPPEIADLDIGQITDITYTKGTVMISELSCSIALSLDGSDASCTNKQDGKIEAMVAGGIGVYNYTWSTGDETAAIENLPAGSYTLTVSDEMGCLDVKEITLMEALEIGASCDDGNANTINDKVTEDCECKGTIEENNSGNTGDTDTETAATIPTITCSPIEVSIEQIICQGQTYEGYREGGTYTDTLKTNNGCDSIRNLTLAIASRVRTQVDTTICEGGIVAGQTKKGSYIDVFTATTGCDSIRILNLSITPTGEAQCMTTSVMDVALTDAYQVGPNPVQDYLTIYSKLDRTSLTSISIYTIYGQLLSNYSFREQQMTLSMQDLPKGTYLLIIESEDRQYLQQLVKI